jgi:hypothetical protein
MRQGAADENDRGVLARNRSDNFAAASREQLQEKKLPAARQAAPQRVEETAERESDLKQKTELASAASAARPNPAASPPPISSAARNEPQPFPSTPAPAKSDVGNVPPPMATAERAPAVASAPAMAERKLAAQSSATGAVSGKLAGNIVGGGAGNAEPAPAQDAAALEKRAGMADKVSGERSKDLVALAPDEWIKRIRRLIADGKNEDAARELAAFRREYKERANALLPSDLRAFKQ